MNSSVFKCFQTCSNVLKCTLHSLDFDGHDYGFDGHAGCKDDLDADDNDTAIIIMTTKISFTSQLGSVRTQILSYF